VLTIAQFSKPGRSRENVNENVCVAIDVVLNNTSAEKYADAIIENVPTVSTDHQLKFCKP
jgi:hypothetical protein